MAKKSRSSASKEKRVRLSYQALTDDQIIRIFFYEFKDLNPMGQGILMEEVKRRGLSQIAQADHNAEGNWEASSVDYDAYIRLIQELPCPFCGNDEHYLKAAKLRTVISALVFSGISESYVAACPDCVRKEQWQAIAKTFFLGWWSIPGGIWKTTSVLYSSIKSLRKGQRESQLSMLEFVVDHIVHLKKYQDDKEKLMLLLRNQNR